MLRKFQVNLNNEGRCHDATLAFQSDGGLNIIIHSPAAPFTQEREELEVNLFSRIAQIWEASVFEQEYVLVRELAGLAIRHARQSMDSADRVGWKASITQQFRALR